MLFIKRSFQNDFYPRLLHPPASLPALYLSMTKTLFLRIINFSMFYIHPLHKICPPRPPNVVYICGWRWQRGQIWVQAGREAGRQGGGRGDRRMPIKSCQGDRYWCRVPQGYFEQVNWINSVLYCLDITKISASKMHRHQMKIKTNTYVHMYNMRQNVE